MTQEDIIRMARESELYLDGENKQQPLYVLKPEELIRFAALIADAEREACARMVEDDFDFVGDELIIAEAIRARLKEQK